MSTVKHKILKSFCNNHSELLNSWKWSLDNLKNNEMIARVQDNREEMNKFNFLFYCLLDERVMKQTHIRSCKQQKAAQDHDFGKVQFVKFLFVNVFEVGLSLSKKSCFICFNENPLKMMKNAFYFILKALFVLKILDFLVT